MTFNYDNFEALAKRTIIYIEPYYCESHRRYHDFDHPIEMINIAGEHFPDLTPEQFMAICFHDIFYKPRNSNNEDISAKMMQRFIRNDKKQYGEVFSTESIQLIDTIIMDTKEHFYPSHEQSKVVLDLDLERLARSYETFLGYGVMINWEYHFLPPKVFRANRMKFFEDMLTLGSIFFTDLGKEKWEPKLRNNIRKFLSQNK